ncbi:MAG: CSLREA domain-containing protein [Caldilineaceae bacterium]
MNETAGNILTGNYIGTDPTQSYAFGNGEHGIFLNSLAHDTQIGGLAPGEGNVVAFHSGRGIWMTAVGTNGNAIRGNSIHDNQGDEIENKLGIDLAGSGPNPNDLGDIDDGANMLQNFPDLIGAYSFDNATVLNGHFNGAANTEIAIDIFFNMACDASGYGEGEFYRESITIQTDAFGNAGFSHVMATATTDQFVTTTATDPDDNTSEFSKCIAVTPALVVNSSDDVNDGSCTRNHCSLREALNVANAVNDSTTIVFGIPGKGPHTISPQSPFPMALYPVTIDGLSQPGAQCSGESFRPAPLLSLDHRTDLIDLIGAFDTTLKKEPPDKEEPPVPITPTLRIELAGTAITAAGMDGLTITGGNSLVRGLAINRFSGNGLVVTTNDNNVVTCNLIGLDPEGLLARGNGLNGILIDESSGNVIGEAATVMASSDPLSAPIPSERNVIAANSGNGILLRGVASANNHFYGNYIGVDATGRVGLGNSGNGIAIEGAPLAVIGAVDATGRLRNVIAGNTLAGIRVADAMVTITGNFIGADMNGTTMIGNGQQGIALSNVTGSTIAKNLIAGNGGHALYLEGGHENQIR